jgi:galactosamine-6-phosphate isomerase
MVQTGRVTDSWTVYEAGDHEALSRQAADFITGEIARCPGLLLCVAAGSTPTRTYDLLAERKQTGPRLFDRLRVLKLDEWGGLDMIHPATCEVYLQKHLIGPLDVPPERYISLHSDSDDPQRECERIRHVLAQHRPIDLCVLGLGANGHLGLNEPAETLEPFVHVAKLAPSSLTHPMLHSVDGQVTYGLTLGMADILRSRKALLLVSGAQKRHQLKRLFCPELSPRFPASLLWLHSNVTLLYDRESALDLNSEAEM